MFKKIFYILFFLNPFYLFGDQVKEWQLGFQKPATDLMSEIINLHDVILWLMTAVTVIVTGLLVYVVFRFRASKNPVASTTSHNTVLEILWTAIPVVILIIIAIPSFKLIYKQESAESYDMTIKVIGHQWYWEYEYPDHGNFYFDSYLVQEEDLKKDDIRLLTVDNPLVLPANKNIQILITAGDVLHSWAVPSMGIKTDAVPGRLNETWVNVKEPGKYRGMCSEICGVGHGYMPIVVEVLPEAEFLAWTQQARNNYAINEDIIEKNNVNKTQLSLLETKNTNITNGDIN